MKSVRPVVVDREGLIAANLNRVIICAKILRRRCPQLGEFDELIAAGNLGLVKAAGDYNANRGAFPGYANVRITGAMLDYLRDFVRSDLLTRSERDNGAAARCSVGEAVLLRMASRSETPAAIAARIDVETLLARIRPAWAHVLRLRYLEDWDVDQIRRGLGVTTTRVRQLLVAGLRACRSCALS